MESGLSKCCMNTGSSCSNFWVSVVAAGMAAREWAEQWQLKGPVTLKSSTTASKGLCKKLRWGRSNFSVVSWSANKWPIKKRLLHVHFYKLLHGAPFIPTIKRVRWIHVIKRVTVSKFFWLYFVRDFKKRNTGSHFAVRAIKSLRIYTCNHGGICDLWMGRLNTCWCRGPRATACCVRPIIHSDTCKHTCKVSPNFPCWNQSLCFKWLIPHCAV